MTLVAEDFLPHVALHESYEAAEEGAQTLHFNLDAPFAREESWLVAVDPPAPTDFGPAALGFHAASTEAEAAEMARRPRARTTSPRGRPR